MKQLTLRAAREALKWKQFELAEQAGLDKATVSRIEAGVITNPSNTTVEKLELALRLKRGTLVFGQMTMERAS